jgi:DNA-binding Xre family transcriptional regulator
MSLEEFMAHWDDPDPWAVPKRVWESRFTELGFLPQNFFVLTDPEVRAMYFERKREETAAAVDPAPSGEIVPNRRTIAIGALSRKIARVLRWKRLTSNVKLREMSRMTGIHPSVLSRIEREQRSITIDELERIAAALDYPIANIVERARSEPLD